MSERYTRLSALPENLYLEGAPVMIVAGALLKDNATGNVLLQLKLRNLADLPLTACQISVRVFAPGGAELAGWTNYDYLDLQVSQGEDFGSRSANALPDRRARRVEVAVTQAVYGNEGVWRHGAEAWEPIRYKRQDLSVYLEDEELRKQYALDVGGNAPYLPETVGSLFFCTCGAINLATVERCSACKRKISDVYAALEPDGLVHRTEVRLKKERAERNRKRRLARKRRQLTVLISLIAIVAVSIALFIGKVVVPGKRYREVYSTAVQLESAGKTAEAAMTFGSLEGYADARERAKSLWDRIVVRNTIDAGAFHTVSLKSDGTAVAAGNNREGLCDVSGWANIESVAAGYYHTVGLKSDRTVVATGYNEDGQCDVSGWTNIVAVEAGLYHTVGLKSDGTVVATGNNETGQCDVSGWTDIVAVTAGESHTVGLKSDGTVVATGYNEDGQCNVSGWTDIVAIESGFAHTAGLKSDGTVVATGYNGYGQCDVSDWTDIVAIESGFAHTAGLKSDGTVEATGNNEYGQCDVSGWTNIVAIGVGFGHTIGLKSDGTVVATGNNEYGQCNVSRWTGIKLPDR